MGLKIVIIDYVNIVYSNIYRVVQSMIIVPQASGFSQNFRRGKKQLFVRFLIPTIITREITCAFPLAVYGA